MTKANLRYLAIQYMRSLQQAGVTDLSAESDRVLGQLTGQLTVESGEETKSVEPDRASIDAPEKSVVVERKAAFDSSNSGHQESNKYGPGLDEPQRIASLEILNQSVIACTRCPELAECRKQTVFGVGSPSPRLAFFGEGPGADEDRLGEPFVGRAGELLNKIIVASKMSREEVYIFNTVKCRPPANRNPSEKELLNCQEYWVAQLEILQPEFICCLGSVAARTLLDTKESVGRLRGKFHTYRDSKVVVTYHPAYLLRTPQAKAKTWDDMKMLMNAMGIDV